MPVDEALVRHIARLARIKVTDAETRTLVGELTGILEWVEQLGEAETDGVEPMTRVVPSTMKKRADAVTDGGIRDGILKNAPETDGRYFVVPKVVE